MVISSTVILIVSQLKTTRQTYPTKKVGIKKAHKKRHLHAMVIGREIMNRIEDEWLHIKYGELAAQVFEDEYEVALALIAAIQVRGERGNYSVERFKFNHV